MTSTPARPVLRPSAVALAAALLLAGCSDSPDTDPEPEPPPSSTPTRLTGVVATGAAVPGATITVRDASATTADATATAGSDGSYAVDVGTLTPPLLVLATGTLNGEPVSVGALVPSVTADADNTANVTPLTTAVADLVITGNLADAFPAVLAAEATSSNVSGASQLVVNTLRTDSAISAALGTGFDPLTTRFDADGTGIDAVLDQLRVRSSDNSVEIINLASPIDENGSQASVTLTPAQTATPTVVPTLPVSSSSTLPTAAEMAALAKKLGDCLALPIDQRVTLDGAGEATAVSATCDFAPAGWRSNGRNWVQQLGTFTFSRGYLTGTTMGQPVIDAVIAPANASGNVFQHPRCNTETCVVMRVPGTTPSGKPVDFLFVLSRIDGQWNFDGNQRPLRIDIEHRVERKAQLNPAKAGSTSYFDLDRVEAAARLIFDPSVGNTADIRTVRWTGPGLPAAGVVTVRSSRCATSDRFTITNQEGQLDVNNSSGLRQWWTGGSATQFVLSASRLDGSAIAMPTPTTNWLATASPSAQDFAPAPVTGAIPAYSVYTAEIFYFTNTGTTPDVVYKLRNTTAYEQASVVAVRSWPTLSQGSIDRYLSPAGAGAGAITSPDQPLSWANPAGGYVSSAYLFSQNRISVTNGEGETALQWQRGRLDYLPATYGDTEAAGGSGWADPRSAVSLSPTSASAGTNPNPRCASEELVPLEDDATNLSYREIGLGFRDTATRKFQNAIWFWNN